MIRPLQLTDARCGTCRFHDIGGELAGATSRCRSPSPGPLARLSAKDDRPFDTFDRTLAWQRKRVPALRTPSITHVRDAGTGLRLAGYPGNEPGKLGNSGVTGAP